MQESDCLCCICFLADSGMVILVIHGQHLLMDVAENLFVAKHDPSVLSNLCCTIVHHQMNSFERLYSHM